MLKDFSSRIVYGKVTLDTVVDGPNIAFGETLSAKLYIEGERSDELIDDIAIELLKVTVQKEEIIAKHSIEMVSADKSKETWMISFEMVPDERWETNSVDDTLIMRTTVHLKNGVNVQSEDMITYS